MENEDLERLKEVKWLCNKSTLQTGKNLDFIKNSVDKESACKILKIEQENFHRYIKENDPNEISYEENRALLGKTYEDIITQLKKYSYLKERDYYIIALWIIGTYFYKNFITFPYLFLNAMKGSGKTRTLKLICCLSWNGQQIGSITEASLFRNAGKGTLGLDEFEGIAKKENSGLREVLNAGYKKGMKIIRMKKKRTPEGEEHVSEYFEPYTPIVMANIWGMEEVLGDRCITAILEKSSKPEYILKMEDFDDNLGITLIKNCLNLLSKTDLVSKCRCFGEKNIYTEWNSWVDDRYSNTTTLSTLTTLTTLYTLEIDSFFNKIVDTGINGRDLELYMPLFIIAKVISDDVCNKILNIAKESTKDKRQDEMMESKDVLLLDFVSKQYSNDYYTLKDLTNNFKNFIDYNQEDEFNNWLNPRWLIRALKRLELILDKRRLASGREVILNVAKAKEKIKMFKNE